MIILGNKIERETITTFLLSLVGLSVFLPIKISSVLIIIATANCLINKDFKNNLKQLFINKISISFLLFFGLIVISALFRTNQTSAISNVERRLSFLVFPLIFSGGVTLNQVKKIVLSFCFGTLIVMFYCIAVAIYKTKTTENLDAFFYHNLSAAVSLNAIYLSIYCVFSIFALLYYYNDLEKTYKKWVMMMIIFLSASVILLSSKNLLIVLVIGILFFLVKRFKTGNKFLFLLPILLVLFTQIKPVKERFLTEINANMNVIKQDTFRYDTPFTGLTLRLVIWKNSITILNENNAWLLGVGIGNFQDLLNKKYVQKGMYTGNVELGDTGYWGYNTHNQWVETMLALGIVGLLILITILCLIFHHYLQQKQVLGLFLFFILISVSLTESVISANKGIVFFTFFLLLFSNSFRKIIS